MFKLNDLIRSPGGTFYRVLGYGKVYTNTLVLQHAKSGRITTNRNPRMFELVGHNYKSTVEKEIA